MRQPDWEGGQHSCREKAAVTAEAVEEWNCTCVCVYVYVRACMRIYIYISVHISVAHVVVCVCVCVCVCVYVHARACMHILSVYLNLLCMWFGVGKYTYVHLLSRRGGLPHVIL